MRWKLGLAVLGVTAAAAFGFVIASAGHVRSAALRERIAEALAARLNADVAIEHLELSFVPLRVSGSGITLRVRDREDLPPFITIDRFRMNLQPFSAARRHVETLHVDGLKIQVPPADARRTLRASGSDRLRSSNVMIERLITHDAELTFVPSHAGQRPHMFRIHSLELDRLGFDRAIDFRAQLVNPVPQGLVEANGSVGPWVTDDPAETPVRGAYVFSNADLSTIDGISGTLSSTGSFEGRITAISVTGTTRTPDFNLALGGRPLPLDTSFAATVDGTNGTVTLRQIDAKLRRTTLKATGDVVNLPGPGRHAIDLQVAVPDGRIEDLLALAMPGGTRVASGHVALRAAVHLPPGPSSVATRLTVNGQFALSRTTFQDDVQARVRELSRRTQGKRADEMDEAVASDVRGAFALSKGVLRLRSLSFEVPGSRVSLDGTANLRTRALDLQGTLRMKASVSQAVGGFRSVLLKLVDPFFRKRGQGTVLPIRIGGTLDAPAPALNFRRKTSQNPEATPRRCSACPERQSRGRSQK